MTDKRDKKKEEEEKAQAESTRPLAEKIGFSDGARRDDPGSNTGVAKRPPTKIGHGHAADYP